MIWNPNAHAATAKARRPLPDYLEELATNTKRRPASPPPTPVVRLERIPGGMSLHDQLALQSDLMAARREIEILKIKLTNALDKQMELQHQIDQMTGSDCYKKRPGRGADLVRYIAQHFDISVGEMCSRSRRHCLLNIRMIAAWVLRRNTILSLPQIGGLLGRRDHTTILHNIRKVEAKPSILAQAEAVERQILIQEREDYDAKR